MSLLKKIDPFRKPTAKEIAARDLEDARRALLRELSAAEYHAKMAEFYRNVETRLTLFLKEE